MAAMSTNVSQPARAHTVYADDVVAKVDVTLAPRCQPSTSGELRMETLGQKLLHVFVATLDETCFLAEINDLLEEVLEDVEAEPLVNVGETGVG